MKENSNGKNQIKEIETVGTLFLIRTEYSKSAAETLEQKFKKLILEAVKTQLNDHFPNCD